MKQHSELIEKMCREADMGWGNLYYHIMPNIINENNLKYGVEVGVAFGGHSFKMLTESNVERLIGIDQYKTYWGGFHDEQSYFDELYEFTKQRLNFPNYELRRKSSLDAANDFEDNEIDFIFIDGDHNGDYVLRELEAWYSKVKPGGMVCGHDYSIPIFPELVKSVDYFFKEQRGLEVIEQGGDVWTVKKPL